MSDSSLDWVTLALQMLGGLVLFLYGVFVLAQALRDIGTDRVRDVLRRTTRSPSAGLATGAVATTILDSSSVTIIMVIALVDAGLLGFAESLGVVVGANIGTTVSSQLFALEVGRFAPLVMASGLLLQVTGGESLRARIGSVLLGFGLVYFGLEYIGEAARPLRAYEPALDLVRRVESPVVGVVVGAALTVVLQSSSATLGIVIALAGEGLITLPAGLALMLGAEIGTCADTLVATLGRSRGALRAGTFHLIFNIASVLLGLAALPWLRQLAEALPGEGVARTVANAHVAFNVIGALLVLPVLRPAASILQRFIPDRPVSATTVAPVAAAG